MDIDVKCKAVISIDIDEYEAFRILVKAFQMDCVLDDLGKYFLL